MPFPFIIALAAASATSPAASDPRLLGRPASHGSDEDETRQPHSSPASVAAPPLKRPGDLARPGRSAVAIGGLVGQLAGFFTIAALITFGGAYAVLPFVANAAVNHYGWRPPRTWSPASRSASPRPGPLIMVNTFVGFVAGYNVGGNSPGASWAP